jgi:O-antigen/teichoic acid export membrane protein
MSEHSSKSYEEVTEKAARGMGWHYLSFGGAKFLSLITLSILARLLLPENFGLLALATLTMDYLAIIGDLGFGAALIQKKDKVIESANVAFWINILANVVLFLILFFIAPYAALFFREDELTSVLRWLSLTFVIKSFGTIHNVLLERELNFKKKLVPDLGSAIIKTIVSITLAWLGFGVWALVIGQLIGVFSTSAILWVLVSWRPKFSWDWGVVKSLFGYGLSIMSVSALTAWEDNFDYLIIGRVFDTVDLGVYMIAYRLPETLILNTMWVMTGVLFPAFSALQHDKEALRKGFLSTVRYVEMLVTPLCLGMFVVADPLIRVFFGEQWVEAIPILRIISLYTLIISIGFHAGDVYKAIGRPDILLKISIPLFPLRLICLWVGAQYSLLGVAYGHLVAEIISTTVNIIVVRRMINVSFFEIMRELKAFLGGAVLIMCTLPVVLLTDGFLPIYQLILSVLAGGVGYLLTLWFVERKSFIGLVGLLGLDRFFNRNGNE